MSLATKLSKSARGLIVTFAIVAIPTLSFAACPVTLKWDPNDIPPDGYRLFVHEKGQAYDYNTPAWEGTDSTGTISGLEEGKTYYTVARAFTGNLESKNSNEVYYTFTEDCKIINTNYPWNLMMPSITKPDNKNAKR